MGPSSYINVFWTEWAHAEHLWQLVCEKNGFQQLEILHARRRIGLPETLWCYHRRKYFINLMLQIAVKWTFRYQNCSDWFFFQRKRPLLKIQKRNLVVKEIQDNYQLTVYFSFRLFRPTFGKLLDYMGNYQGVCPNPISHPLVCVPASLWIKFTRTNKYKSGLRRSSIIPLSVLIT